VDEEREKAQFDRVKALAHEMGLNPEFAEKFLRCVISEVVQNCKTHNYASKPVS
jgi:chorismate mutase